MIFFLVQKMLGALLAVQLPSSYEDNSAKAFTIASIEILNSEKTKVRIYLDGPIQEIPCPLRKCRVNLIVSLPSDPHQAELRELRDIAGCDIDRKVFDLTLTGPLIW